MRSHIYTREREKTDKLLIVIITLLFCNRGPGQCIPCIHLFAYEPLGYTHSNSAFQYWSAASVNPGQTLFTVIKPRVFFFTEHDRTIPSG